MERNIPDVRDIFGRNDSNSRQKPELRCYEYSPRSRRKQHDILDNSRPAENRLPTSTNNKDRRSSRQRTEDVDLLVRHKKSDDKSSKINKDYPNRTLTERDIRHLERHLSMKKTIRKQISRNLAQAFVDDPDLVLKNEAYNSPPPASSKPKVDRSFTLTRAKVSKSEQNVLDLLKDNEPDSGHCSADNPNSSDDEYHDMMKQRPKVQEKAAGNVVNRMPDSSQRCAPRDEAKFSFWKMFSVKNKNKR